MVILILENGSLKFSALSITSRHRAFRYFIVDYVPLSLDVNAVKIYIYIIHCFFSSINVCGRKCKNTELQGEGIPPHRPSPSVQPLPLRE